MNSFDLTINRWSAKNLNRRRMMRLEVPHWESETRVPDRRALLHRLLTQLSTLPLPEAN